MLRKPGGGGQARLEGARRALWVEAGEGRGCYGWRREGGAALWVEAGGRRGRGGELASQLIHLEAVGAGEAGS